MNKILDVDANSIMVLYPGQIVKLEGKEWRVVSSGPIVDGWYQAELEPWGWHTEPAHIMDDLREACALAVLGSKGVYKP
jgi:hypothetical protein